MQPNRHRFTDHELVERLRLLQKHKGNQAAAARAMGCAPSGFRSSIQEAKRRGLTPTTRTLDSEARLKTELALAKQELAATRREADTAESIRKEIFNLAAMTPNPPRWLLPKPRKFTNENIPVVVWSDWHFGERVNRIEVGGVNEFNRAIAKKRVQKLVAKTIELCKHHMVKPNYEGIVVCLGGDMITGAIHEELGATNDGTVQQAIWELQGILIWAIEKIADEFGKVFIPAVVGNHARDTHRPRMKGAVLQNYEWTLYNQLELYFRDDKRVQFMIPGETDAYFTVKGHRFLLTHGDRLGVAGGDGQIGMLGPVVRGTQKVARSERQIGRDFDTMLCCHYHSFVPRSDACPVIVNGALKGYDEYARLALRVPYSRPSQALFFVNPRLGIVCQWQIYLEEEQRSIRENRDWVRWQNGTRYDSRAAA
jgi:hypothetical protein